MGLLMESETMPTSPLAEPLPSITATIVGFSTVELSPPPPPFTLLTGVTLLVGVLDVDVGVRGCLDEEEVEKRLAGVDGADGG